MLVIHAILHICLKKFTEMKKMLHNTFGISVVTLGNSHILLYLFYNFFARDVS